MLILLRFIHELLSDTQDNASCTKPGNDAVTHTGGRYAG